VSSFLDRDKLLVAHMHSIANVANLYNVSIDANVVKVYTVAKLDTLDTAQGGCL
jgi:hypothetical protein